MSKIGRNDKCPCGSGQKYKNCCFKKRIIFESPRNLRNILKFANTDITSLKSSVRPLKRTHSERETNLNILNDICSHFKIEDGIGICNKSNLICRGWECDNLINCKEKCVESCPVNKEDSIYIIKTPKEYKKAFKLCNSEINSLTDALEPEEVIGYLTSNLERCAAEALTTSPSELVSIMKIRDWMYQKYGDLRKYEIDFEYTNEAELYKLWNYLIQIQILEENISMLSNRDVALVFTSKGYEEFKEITKDPLYDIKKKIERLKEYEENPDRTKEIFTRERCKSIFWTYNMKDVIKWCYLNNLDPEPGGVNFHEQYYEIMKHVQEINTGSKFDPTECLNLGWPLFITFFHIFRYCALKFPWLVNIIDLYKDTQFEKIIFEEYGFSPWNWDNFIYEIPWPDNDPFGRDLEIYSPSPKSQIEQHQIWPIYVKKDILNLSKLIIGFGIKYYDDLFTDPRITGDWFEEVLTYDILMRKIPIKEKNYDLPDRLGDIDILAFDVYWNYLIEAKDWGPRGKKSGYFSSKDYDQRLRELHEEIDKLGNRIEWLKNNRSKLDIPENTGIMGLFITSFIEPHLKSPDDIIHIPHGKLCAIFGGEAINPILTGRGHPMDLKFIEEINKRNQKKNKDIKKILADQPDGDEKLINEHVLNRLLEIYGDINAYHVYRMIYEITEAYRLKGVSIKEVTANWIERPPILTKQYISFVLYRGDDLSLEEIEESIEILIKKGLIKRTNNMFILEKIPETEFWKLHDNKFILVDNQDEANVIINEKHSGKIPEGLILVGMLPPIIMTSKGGTMLDFRYD